MADIVDRGNDRVEEITSDALGRIRRQAAQLDTAGIGVCINCGVPVDGDVRWCDDECRADWQRSNNYK